MVDELIIAKDEAEESNRLKTAFLQNLSHEIRTPMNAIIGFNRILKESTNDPEMVEECVDAIDKSGERLITLINDLVDLSKIEAGIISIEKEAFDLNTILGDLHQFFLGQAKEKGLSLALEKTPASSDSRVVSDKTKVFQVLSNLINNAIKFTKEGSVSFGGSKEDGRALFYVKDTGIGIPKDKQEVIFERFVQGDTSISRGYEGAGLGLAISKSFVAKMGGTIWLESEQGKGTTFFVSIPDAEARQDLSSPKNKSLLHGEFAESRGLKIMIADDDAPSLLLLEAILRPLSSVILKATNGSEAIEVFQENSDFDVIFMDIKMPVVDGLSATKAIRSFDKDVIIIAQTAYAFPGDKERAMDVGCNDYITKPIDGPELMSIMQKHFGKHQVWIEAHTETSS
jgi:CheY-like chemotaxis protein